MAAQKNMAIAVLDDYQRAALEMADWSRIQAQARVTVFPDTISDRGALIERLLPFDVVCVMRERTPLDGALLRALPRLKLIASTGPRNASIDVATAEACGITVTHTGYFSEPTVELAWALILATTRNIVAEHNSVANGGWQVGVGEDLSGRTLGIFGLGNVGGAVARIGKAFGMQVLAYSDNLTEEAASAAGVQRVNKERLFAESDIVSVHVVLSERTRGAVGAPELALMKPTARLVNTSRSPIVDSAALISALHAGTIGGAAIDVYDTEPLGVDDPLRTAPNLVHTPHIGYVSKALYRTFFGDTVRAVEAWLGSHAA